MIGEIVYKDNFSFKKIKSIDKEIPYRVRCLENGEEKDSYISYEDAIELILGNISFAESRLIEKSKDESYIRGIFEQNLKGHKLSEADGIVKNKISEEIYGDVFYYRREKFSNKDVYTTSIYKVTAINEYGRYITSIQVEEL